MDLSHEPKMAGKFAQIRIVEVEYTPSNRYLILFKTEGAMTDGRLRVALQHFLERIFDEGIAAQIILVTDKDVTELVEWKHESSSPGSDPERGK
jgi:hypothetical protein